MMMSINDDVRTVLILECCASFSYRQGQSKLTTSECIAQINHYGKITPLHKLILTALQFIN